MNKQKLIVIGNGMAGMRTVDELLQLAPNRYEITVFGAEPHGNYNRIMLTPLLFGAKSVDDIMIHDFAWYRRNRITLYCGTDKAVVAVDRANRRVIAKDGTSAEYDKLVIATGSLPLMLDIPGRETEGVMGFRDIADVQTMIEKSQTKQHAVVLGGGLLGLEAANGLMQRGMQVTVVNRAGHLLNRQLDKQAAGFLQRQLEDKGIEFRLGVTISEIISQDEHIGSVRLSDNSLLPADILVMATGIQPNIALGQAMGLACERGILVNDTLQTSDENIYSVGECVEHRGEIFGLVAPVYEQAKVCAQHLAGRASAAYRTLLSATMLKVTGIDLFSVGDFEGDSTCHRQVLIDHAQGVYRKIVLKDNVIAGMIMYGDTSGSAWYLNLVKNRTNVVAMRDRLIFNPVDLAA
ncbi:MAG: FAD-dependent oxidoreductase [Methylomonas sp.]|jgi:nitrite reductase (NADH) large subunit|uniref:NAD(P)/FAD-dependent oxidoreductase n=1 Tax=Methylomonas sp. TaxID=418 RepID=UPI0025E8DEAE|nr:FAD-dependent oxidoreductase [Methylomonas sp.]MCK9608339.1 FAD-dependent oxidoreductase [Methylomonas sp.]